jgi:glycine cleavage system H protein
MSAVPAELKYTNEHEWAKVEGDIITIGITDHAQSELGDIVFVELPEVGDEFAKGEAFGTIEAVKTVAELYSPVSGVVTEINESLADLAETINTAPYEAGWIIKMKLRDGTSELDDLMDAKSYSAFIQ